MSDDPIYTPKLNKSTSKKIPEPEHLRKHKIWREKQIYIFYGSGRPIYKTVTENKHQYYTTTDGNVIGSYNS